MANTVRTGRRWTLTDLQAETPLVLRVEDVAATLDVSIWTVYEMVKDGRLSNVQGLGHRVIRIPTYEVFRVLGVEEPARPLNSLKGPTDKAEEQA
jgi:excisionase family DNA binding protein